MDDPNQLREFVRCQILEGHDSSTKFMNLYRHFTGSDPNTIIEHYPEVENWLGQVKSYAIDQIPNSIPEKFYLLLKTIHVQFKKAARSLEARKSVNDRNLNTYDL